MTEYIKREAVAELFNKWADGYSYIEVPTKDAIACVRAIPAADVVEPKRGEWYDRGSLSCRCSNCGCKSPEEYSFCPNCGADMRGRKDG